MNSQQITAFLSAAGTNVSMLATVITTITAATLVLWAARVVQKLGTEALEDNILSKTQIVYIIRVLIIVMLTIYLLS